MSESDDTDVLLLIPPDLFVVPSSDSDDSDCRPDRRYNRGTGVVSEILEHVQSLETRITAIESKDNSLDVSLLNASLDSQFQSHSYPLAGLSPARASRGKYFLGQLSSLPGTPAKPRHCSSVKSSPSFCRQSSYATDKNSNEMRLSWHAQNTDDNSTVNGDSCFRKRQDLSQDHSSFLPPSNSNRTTLRGSASLGRDVRRRASFFDRPDSDARTGFDDTDCKFLGNRCDDKRAAKEMELSEVDELLQEMEATEVELARRIKSSNSHSEARERLTNFRVEAAGNFSEESKPGTKLPSPMRRLDFQFVVDDVAHGGFDPSNLRRDQNCQPFADVSLPDDDAFHLENTDKIISSFKTWNHVESMEPGKSGGRRNEEIQKADKTMREKGESTDRNFERLRLKDESSDRQILNDNYRRLGESRVSRSSETSDVESHVPSAKSSNCRSLPNIKNSTTVTSLMNDCGKMPGNVQSNDTVNSGLQGTRQSTNDFSKNSQQSIRQMRTTGQQRTNSPVARNSETYPRQSQRLLALSDFWDCDGTKSQEEMLRIRLEEEKFRREHCEHLIQELQKRLLEQQEKVAVAIRVDNEKNAAISQFHNAWSKLKQRWESLEKDHTELESRLRNVTDSHSTEISEYQQQIKRGEGELSKALDLAAGYKEKSDALVKEKLDLLKSHADELEKYKCLVQEAEQRYEHLKTDYGKLLDRNKQLEEIGKNAQQELNKERLRNSEVRTEMAVIHKALDACEAELTILRQEKENLQLKIKEEVTRNGILEQNKTAMLEAVNEAKNAEKMAKDESKSLADRHEQIRAELRQVYQNQVDDVVKTKLKEFQEQLDAAEMAFQVDLETKQRAIAECAARKIKSIIDKHQLEINLLEQKHMEEKRLGEIQLAQASQKAAMLEAQLSTQRATKTHLAEQLHSVMQKQWQQALQIISGGNMENLSPLQRLNAERFFESKKSKRCYSACCNKEVHSTKPEMRTMSTLNLQSSNSRQEQDESLVTLTSNDETPLTTRKDSKDDIRKYIQMILDMQQPKNDFGQSKYIQQSSEGSPPVSRQVPRKHYTKKDQNGRTEQQTKDDFGRSKYVQQSDDSPPAMSGDVPRKYYTKKEQNGLSEESVAWQNIDEPSVHDTSEYAPIVQSQGSKGDQQRNKPPWK